MSNIINFPLSKDMESRHFSNKIDKEIEEIKRDVDQKIIKNYGSLEGLGRAIIKNILKGRA